MTFGKEQGDIGALKAVFVGRIVALHPR